MKVLVTGVTGGLGELVIENLLSRNLEVIATARNEEKARSCSFYPLVNFKPYDIGMQSSGNLYDYFERPDAMIHLAWEKLNEYRNPAHTHEILDKHKKFLSDLIAGGLKNITITGTCYEYGLKEGELEEGDLSAPVLPYPEAKNLLRQYLEQQQAQHDFALKWLRIFYMFGPVKGRKNLYTLINDAVKNGDASFNMSGGEQVRDFLTPGQIAEMIVELSLQTHVQGIINCCSGKPVKLRQFVESFLEENHYKLHLNLGYYPYPDYEPMETWGSVQKLRSALGENKFEN